jgi:L-2,4-diaminobutyrate decarboxylase
MRQAPLEEVSRLQAALRARLARDGRFYITATRLDGAMVLRVTLMNPLTERRHLEGMLDAIRRLDTP